MLGHLYCKERVCPYCGSHDVARSHRRGLFAWLLPAVLRLRPYRCRECWRRFVGYVGAERVEPSGEDQRAA